MTPSRAAAPSVRERRWPRLTRIGQGPATPVPTARDGPPAVNRANWAWLFPRQRGPGSHAPRSGAPQRRIYTRPCVSLRLPGFATALPPGNGVLLIRHAHPVRAGRKSREGRMIFAARRLVWIGGTVLGILCIAGLARAGEGESALQVEYNPPWVSVEARGVNLSSVLTEIGAKAGFGVVVASPSSTMITLSIRDASLDDVLRQLLRGESHTVTYRAGSNAIDRIVLLGDPGTATAATTPSQPPPVQAQPSGAPHGGPSQTAALPQLGPPPAAAEPGSTAAPEPQAAPGAPGEGETAQVNLGDV